MLPIDPPVLVAPWKLPTAAPKPAAPPTPAPAPTAPPTPPPSSKGRRKKVNTDAPITVASSGTIASSGTHAPAPVITVANTGTHVAIPLPYQPVSPLEAMASSNPHVLSVMLRQLRDMKGVQPDTSNGVLVVMDGLSDGFKHGKDVTKHLDAVTLHLTGRSERRELMSELGEVLDDERLIEIFKSRSKFEDFLHSCQRRSDVTVSEGIAIQAYFNNEMDKIFGRRNKRMSGEAPSSQEPHELVVKANLPTQVHRKELQHKFNEASPQEREILRKLGFKVQSMVAARLTKTTTETIELVEDDGSVTKRSG